MRKKIKSIQKTCEPIITLDGKSVVDITEEDLQKLFPINMPATIYNNVDTTTEFGVARFMADQVYHLSSLLNVASIEYYGEVNFGISASKLISNDKQLGFSYRFTATDSEEAKKIAAHIKQQLNGIMRRIWLAAWSVGDEIKKHTFSISLLKLMKACYPERTTNFSGSEIEDFYQTLKSMKPAEFILSRKYKSKQKGKQKYLVAKFIISFLQVHFELGEENKTPNEVVISLYNVTPLPPKEEKTRYVGVPIKKGTLNLNSKDTALALWLQTRINQKEGGGSKKKNVNSEHFSRSQLIEESNLQKTDASNPRMANKQLREKLQRCKDEGIISEYPLKITQMVLLRWD